MRSRNATVLSALSALLVAAAGIVPAGRAEAQQPSPLSGPRVGAVDETWRTIVNYETAQRLAVSGSSDTNGAPVVQWLSQRPNGQTPPEQTWLLIQQGGYLTLRNGGTPDRKALAIGNGSTTRGAGAIQWTHSGRPEQQWRQLDDPGRRAFRLQNRATGLCLAIPNASIQPGTQAVQWPCGSGDEQFWFSFHP